MGWRASNTTLQILAAAEKGRYGILAAIVSVHSMLAESDADGF